MGKEQDRKVPSVVEQHDGYSDNGGVMMVEVG